MRVRGVAEAAGRAGGGGGGGGERVPVRGSRRVFESWWPLLPGEGEYLRGAGGFL